MAVALSSVLLALAMADISQARAASAASPSPTAVPPSTAPPTSAPPGTTPTTPAPATPSPAPAAQLSEELTLSSWAHPEETGPIYPHPEKGPKVIARVHMYTADGFPEVYPVLSSQVDARGVEWDRVRIPGRPNGRTGWVRRELLGGIHRTRWWIVVNRAKRRMRVYHEGHLLRVFPVGVGKPSTPTPAGHFWIDERFKLSNPNNPYWPYALGTSDYSTLRNWPGEGVIGIHGPFGEPQRIPGDPSHGCIRMLSRDISWLGPRATLGTPVDVT